MESQKIDRRILKTKRQLRHGLAELLQIKKINKITVRELCDLIDINRTTFYTHYHDIYDLLEQIENEVFAELQQVLAPYALSSVTDGLKPFLTQMYKYIAENSYLAKALLGPNGDMVFVRKIQGLMQSFAQLAWNNVQDKEVLMYKEYISTFVVNGCTGMLENWLKNGMAESVDDMAALVDSLLRNGLQAI